MLMNFKALANIYLQAKLRNFSNCDLIKLIASATATGT